MHLFASDFRDVSKNHYKSKDENYKDIEVYKTQIMENGIEELKIWD